MTSSAAYHWIEQVCPICDSKPGRFLGRRGGSAHREGAGVVSNVWQCLRCGLIFPNPMPVPVDGLDQHYDLDPDVYFAQHDVAKRQDGVSGLLDQVERYTGGKGSLLDVGSGRGEVLKGASERGWSVTGIEPSARFADRAARYSGVTDIRSESIERCGFPPDSFDVVILQALLEHLYHPDETIREVARLLKAGGVLYADVPNEAGLYSRVGNLYQKLRGRDWVVNLSPTFSPFHVFGFSTRSLKALYRKHGLEPFAFTVRGGKLSLPTTAGFTGWVEYKAAGLVTDVANSLGMGTYIASWARKNAAPPLAGQPRIDPTSPHL